MAVLTPKWERLDRLSPATEAAAVVTGQSASEPSAEEAEAQAAPALLERPVLVYVPDPEGGAQDKAESIVLGADQVCIGTWAFRCIKMDDAQAKADPALAEGKTVPRFYVVGRDYSAQLLEGKSLSAKKMFKAMERVANRTYKQKLKKRVTGLLKVLNEFDRIANERRVLERKIERKGENAKTERTQKELDERQAKADAQKKELITFELK